MEHPALDVLFRQRDAWNIGDREGYLAECAAEVVYVSARGVVFGRDALSKSLTDAYPDPLSMGTLSLHVLKIDATPHEVRVVLRWQVDRAQGPVGGAALLILQVQEGVWRVTHDATVSAA